MLRDEVDGVRGVEIADGEMSPADATQTGTSMPLLTARVLLIGMMGAGKTTIGLTLAHRTGWRYVDNDELLLLITGRSARELLATGGETSLRAGEIAVLERALDLPPPVIVGIAAGVVLDPVARLRLREVGQVVWLRASPSTLIPRVSEGTHRPFVERDGKDWIERTAVERESLYREVARSIVDVDDRTPEQITDDVLAALQAMPASGQMAPRPSTARSGHSADPLVEAPPTRLD